MPKPATPKPRPAATKPPKVDCGGALAFGAIVNCAIVRGQRHVFTVAVSAPADELVVQFREEGDPLGGTITDAQGGRVCFLHLGSMGDCKVDSAGTYTITVEPSWPTGSGTYWLSVNSFRQPTTCRTLTADFFAMGSPGLDGHLLAGSAGDCYQFDQPADAVLRLYEVTRDDHSDVQGEIRNAAWERVCQLRYSRDCTLTGKGPYRFFLYDYYGLGTPYHLQMERLSNPVGCAPLALAPFGDPGAATATGALKADQLRCHLVTAAAGRHVIRLHTLAGEARWQVYDADGRRHCTEPGDFGSCELPEAGRYSVHVENSGWTDVRYKLAVVPLVGNEGCAASIGTAWTQPTITVRPAALAQVNCQSFTANAGERIVVYRTEAYGWYVANWITDDTGAQICPQWNEGLGCALPAGGPYRLISYLSGSDGSEEPPAYGVQIRNASTPVGCPVVKPGVYGAEPAGPLGGIRCRSLDVPAAGRYAVETLDDTNSSTYGVVYDAEGKELCQTVCTFSEPGTYLLVIDRSLGINDSEYVTAFLPYTGAGCVQTSDQGLNRDPVQGSIRTAGQYNCLELPSPAGSRITFLLPQDAAATAVPDVRVVDATGEWLCDLYALEEGNCELTGAAPFRIVLSGRDDYATSDYRAVITRTDGLTGCGAFPQGKFGADTGAAAALTADRYATCRTINADQHSAVELVALNRTAGTGAARLILYGTDGQRACSTSKGQFRYADCPLNSTGSYTAIVTGSAATASYQLTRRDLTSTAAGCQQVTSLAVGGASASGTVGSISDFRCHQVTAGAGDRIWLDTRDAANSIRYFVTGPAGQDQSCVSNIQPCLVSGSTKYQLIVMPPGAVTAPVNYRVDAWQLNAGTAPPSACTVVPDVSQGFGPFTGALSDAKPGTCLTMTVAYWNRFRVELTNTEGGAPLPRPYLVTSRGLRVCDGVAVGSYSCAPYIDGQTEKILLVLGSGDAVGRLPYKIVATCEATPCGGNA